MRPNNLLLAAASLSLIAAIAGCGRKQPAESADERAEPQSAAQAEPGVPNPYEAYVDAEGAISLPENFATDWAHLGSWGVVEDGGVADLHNVYAPKRDIEYFQANGAFGDGAMLVKEVRGARGAAHTTGDAHWAEGVKVWFVMVKDTQGRFPDNPLWGDGWGWALFNGDNPGVQAAADYKKDCLDCHAPARETDWVYTYAYPVLGEAALSTAPVREASLDEGAVQMAAMSDTNEDAMSEDDAMSENMVSGEDVFVRCRACHSLEPGRHGVGPSLADVFGRKAGAAEGFAYSPQMRASDVVWDAETLDAHLADANSVIPGNRMALMFPTGVPDKAERAAVISYLEEAAGE